MPTCHVCGHSGVFSSDSTGDTTCATCGTVLEAGHIVNQVEFEETAGGSSLVVGQYVSATSSKPYGSSLGAGGYLMTKGSQEVSLDHGKRAIHQIVSQLNIQSSVAEAAVRVYQLALKGQFTHGRRAMHVAAACLYISCRRSPESCYLLIDFAEALQTNVFVLGTTYIKLCRAVKLDLPIVDPSLYMHRFAAKLDLGDGMQRVSSTALKLLARMKRDWLGEGRRPAGLCGACLLVACRIHGYARSTLEVSQVVRVTELTVRNRLAEFENTPASLVIADDVANETDDALAMLDDEEADTAPPSFVRGLIEEEIAKERFLMDMELIADIKGGAATASSARGQVALMNGDVALVEDDPSADLLLLGDVTAPGSMQAIESVVALPGGAGKGSSSGEGSSASYSQGGGGAAASSEGLYGRPGLEMSLTLTTQHPTDDLEAELGASVPAVYEPPVRRTRAAAVAAAAASSSSSSSSAGPAAGSGGELVPVLEGAADVLVGSSASQAGTQSRVRLLAGATPLASSSIRSTAALIPEDAVSRLLQRSGGALARVVESSLIVSTADMFLPAPGPEGALEDDARSEAAASEVAASVGGAAAGSVRSGGRGASVAASYAGGVLARLPEDDDGEGGSDQELYFAAERERLGVDGAGLEDELSGEAAEAADSAAQAALREEAAAVLGLKPLTQNEIRMWQLRILASQNWGSARRSFVTYQKKRENLLTAAMELLSRRRKAEARASETQTVLRLLDEEPPSLAASPRRQKRGGYEDEDSEVDDTAEDDTTVEEEEERPKRGKGKARGGAAAAAAATGRSSRASRARARVGAEAAAATPVEAAAVLAAAAAAGGRRGRARKPAPPALPPGVTSDMDFLDDRIDANPGRYDVPELQEQGSGGGAGQWMAEAVGGAASNSDGGGEGSGGEEQKPDAGQHLRRLRRAAREAANEVAACNLALEKLVARAKETVLADPREALLKHAEKTKRSLVHATVATALMRDIKGAARGEVDSVSAGGAGGLPSQSTMLRSVGAERLAGRLLDGGEAGEARAAASGGLLALTDGSPSAAAASNSSPAGSASSSALVAVLGTTSSSSSSSKKVQLVPVGWGSCSLDDDGQPLAVAGSPPPVTLASAANVKPADLLTFRPMDATLRSAANADFEGDADPEAPAAEDAEDDDAAAVEEDDDGMDGGRTARWGGAGAASSSAGAEGEGALVPRAGGAAEDGDDSSAPSTAARRGRGSRPADVLSEDSDLDEYLFAAPEAAQRRVLWTDQHGAFLAEQLAKKQAKAAAAERSGRGGLDEEGGGGGGAASGYIQAPGALGSGGVVVDEHGQAVVSFDAQGLPYNGGAGGRKASGAGRGRSGRPRSRSLGFGASDFSEPTGNSTTRINRAAVADLFSGGVQSAVEGEDAPPPPPPARPKARPVKMAAASSSASGPDSEGAGPGGEGKGKKNGGAASSSSAAAAKKKAAAADKPQPSKASKATTSGAASSSGMALAGAMPLATFNVEALFAAAQARLEERKASGDTGANAAGKKRKRAESSHSMASASEAAEAAPGQGPAKKSKKSKSKGSEDASSSSAAPAAADVAAEEPAAAAPAAPRPPRTIVEPIGSGRARILRPGAEAAAAAAPPAVGESGGDMGDGDELVHEGFGGRREDDYDVDEDGGERDYD